jgi:hypothetical protein
MEPPPKPGTSNTDLATDVDLKERDKSNATIAEKEKEIEELDKDIANATKNPWVLPGTGKDKKTLEERRRNAQQQLIDATRRRNQALRRLEDRTEKRLKDDALEDQTSTYGLAVDQEYGEEAVKAKAEAEKREAEAWRRELAQRQAAAKKDREMYRRENKKSPKQKERERLAREKKQKDQVIVEEGPEYTPPPKPGLEHPPTPDVPVQPMDNERRPGDIDPATGEKRADNAFSKAFTQLAETKIEVNTADLPMMQVNTANLPMIGVDTSNVPAMIPIGPAPARADPGTQSAVTGKGKDMSRSVCEVGKDVVPASF